MFFLVNLKRAILPPLPPTATATCFRATLRHGLGHALASAAGHGGTHWCTAEQVLVNHCVARHPMTRALCLDVWSDLVASAPPLLAEQHHHQLLHPEPLPQQVEEEGGGEAGGGEDKMDH